MEGAKVQGAHGRVQDRTDREGRAGEALARRGGGGGAAQGRLPGASVRRLPPQFRKADVRVLRDRPQDVRRRAGYPGASAGAEGGRGVRCFVSSDPFHPRRGPGESRPLSAAASAETGGRRAEGRESVFDETRGADRSFSPESAQPETPPEDRAIDRIEPET